MFRKSYLAISYAAGQEFCRRKDFWVYIDSIAKLEDTTKVVLTHDMPDDIRQQIRDKHINVIDIPTGSVELVARDRYLAYWNFLVDHGHKYKYVLVTDSRDVYIQSDPFAWIDQWKNRFSSVKGDLGFLDHFVILTSEGFSASKSPFACIEQYNFQQDVPEPFKKEDRANRQIVNSGVTMGTPRAMQDYVFLNWIVTMKTSGQVTDQATLNYLYYYLEDDESYCLSSPHNDWFCVTGEGVKEGFVNKPILKDGMWCNPNVEGNPPYCILHQWDRLDYLTDFLTDGLGAKDISL